MKEVLPYAYKYGMIQSCMPTEREGNRMKETLLQAFEWELASNGGFWNRLAREASRLKKTGFTGLWLPPAYKGYCGSKDVGYGVYDLYDLGEFDQKGSVRTKYGTKDQYLHCIKALQKHKLKVIADIVLDHRLGADYAQDVRVVKVDGGNRNHVINAPYNAKLWSGYSFEGRHHTYSAFEWNWTCFTGADYDANNGQNGVMRIESKQWNPRVSRELGNYDFVMGMSVDFCAPWVVQELTDWGKWYQSLCHVDGFRLDCLKSIDDQFFKSWLPAVHSVDPEREQIVLGEYWTWSVPELIGYLERSGNCMRLFDVPLHYHLHDCSKSHGTWDVRKIFDDTLFQARPHSSVVFVDNHDTQPGQALDTWVDGWFKTSAYACILLHEADLPCVFWGDLKGLKKPKTEPVPLLEEMIWIRQHLLSDHATALFDEDPQKACWIMRGEHPVLVIFSIGDGKSKSILFDELKGKTFIDIADPNKKTVMDRNGWGTFSCYAGCCSIYILESDYQKMKRSMRWKKWF